MIFPVQSGSQQSAVGFGLFSQNTESKTCFWCSLLISCWCVGEYVCLFVGALVYLLLCLMVCMFAYRWEERRGQKDKEGEIREGEEERKEGHSALVRR